MLKVKHVLIFAHDVFVVGAAVLVALYLRLGADAWGIEAETLASMVIIAMAVGGSVFAYFEISKCMWRYFSREEIVVVAQAVTVAVLLFVTILYLLETLTQVPRSVPAIQWLITFVALGGSRLLYRMVWHERRFWFARRAPKAIPVLLVGASARAEEFITEANTRARTPYHVVGLLDEARELRGRSIHGVRVLGNRADLSRVIARLGRAGQQPQKLIIADDAGPVEPGLLEEADRLGLGVARLPRSTDFRSPVEEDRPTLQPVALEDLLGRPQAPLNRNAIRRLIAGRRLLVTGAGGTIGSEITRQVAALKPAQVVLLDSSEFNLYTINCEVSERWPHLDSPPVLCNIRERNRVVEVFSRYRPEIVFHAAALKHVPMVELNPCEGVLTNVRGTRNVAEATRDFGAMAMVQVSSDKAVNPTNVMGATKRLAEFQCQALDAAGAVAETGGERTPRYMTVRFGNVLGSSGSVVPLFQRQLAKGGPLTVTHPEITRYFMTVREAVELVLQASAHGLEHPEERGQILVLDMGQPIKVVDIASQMIQLAGLRPDVDIRIEFKGLRPGEKLYEELFGADEIKLPHPAPGLLVAMSRPIDSVILSRMFDELSAASERGDWDRAKRIISSILPSYRPGPTVQTAASAVPRSDGARALVNSLDGTDVAVATR